MNEEKKKEVRRSEIEIFAPLVLKSLIVGCLPWVLISGLDRQLDSNSESGFEWWNFYWSFPATHLSWLVLTFLFGLPLWGLLGAPLVLLACVFTGVTEVSLFMLIIGAIIVASTWIVLYYTVRHYRSTREISKIRREIYREEGELNEA